MSYIIESEKLTVFLESSKIKLPRFQRKSTWDKKQKFELCISVFQDYPVGVVILNEVQNTSWLLDGRQRREALIQMRDNPVELYDWARNYIGFNKTADELEISTAYWNKVARFLQTEEHLNKDNSAEDDDINTYSDDDEEGQDYSSVSRSFDSSLQRKGLETLLNIILMVHQIKSTGSRWQKLFDFQKYFFKLKYAPQKLNGKIDPVALRKYLLDLISEIKKEYDGDITQENFVEVYKNDFTVKDEGGFIKCVKDNWEQIKTSLQVIDDSENIFTSARIGIIRLSKASPLDAQNIFSRINRNGTQLKAEELLSAKPYWNVAVNNPSFTVKESVKNMYSKLGIVALSEVCRWDIAATLISRIKDDRLIFDTYDEAKEKNEISMDEVTLGFKLLSSIFRSGMSNKHVIEIETEDCINWEEDVDSLIEDINSICKLLRDDPFFSFYLSWKKPVTKLLGNAIALEFVTVLWHDWKAKDRPTGGAKYKALQRDARILFDRLVFEYSTRAWRGSGDSKMANDIKNWENRILPIEESAWKSLIQSVCAGEYNGQTTSKKSLNPVLHYYYVLKEMSPTIDAQTKFEVDHIYPEEKFQNNSMADQKLKDSLINFALLPKKENISKSSKALNEITDPWLKEQVSRFTEIPQSDFDKYSNIANIGELQGDRKKLFIETFTATRKAKLSN